ncbi:MAG TPA: nucleotidyltransferase domain-containing protein [Acidobacteriota bacterium]|jgi:predicted nucleotidyltransferase
MPTTLREKRQEYVHLLEISLKRLVAVLKNLDEVERISLFGSYASGRRDLMTDLDVLVVMRTDELFVDRLRRLYGLLALPVDLDILCYTPKEFSELKSGGWLKKALEGETLLYEKEPAGRR